MADDADRAQETLEGLSAHMLRATKRPAPFFTGKCLYCDETVEDERLFCDNKATDDCHGEYEREAAIRAKQTMRQPFFGSTELNAGPGGGTAGSAAGHGGAA